MMSKFEPSFNQQTNLAINLLFSPPGTWLIDHFHTYILQQTISVTLALNYPLDLIALSFSSDKAAAVRSDAAAELDRLTRSQKKVLPSSGPSSLDNSLNNSSSDC